MSGLLLAAIAACGILLAGGDNNKVPVPDSNWRDDVGRDISSQAKQSVYAFNSAVDSCISTIERIKSEADCNRFEVDARSREFDIEWIAKKINNADIDALQDDIKRALGG